MEPDRPNHEFQGGHPGAGAGRTRRFHVLTFLSKLGKIVMPAGAAYFGLRSCEIDTLVQMQGKPTVAGAYDAPAFDDAQAASVAAGEGLVTGPVVAGHVVALRALDDATPLGDVVVALEGAEIDDSPEALGLTDDPSFVDTTLADATEEVAYDEDVTIADGDAPFTGELDGTSDPLPAGIEMTVDPDTGTFNFAGTPEDGTAAAYDLVLNVFDNLGRTAQQAITLTVNA